VLSTCIPIIKINDNSEQSNKEIAQRHPTIQRFNK